MENLALKLAVKTSFAEIKNKTNIAIFDNTAAVLERELAEIVFYNILAYSVNRQGEKTALIVQNSYRKTFFRLFDKDMIKMFEDIVITNKKYEDVYPKIKSFIEKYGK